MSVDAEDEASSAEGVLSVLCNLTCPFVNFSLGLPCFAVAVISEDDVSLDSEDASAESVRSGISPFATL